MKLHRVGLWAAAVWLACGVAAGAAQAHGGIPAPQQILWRGDSMLVPTPYWGLFVGKPGGGWHWICDEAINAYQQHTFAVSGSGTLYATDRMGMQVSRDAGCSWESITGPLASQYVLNIQASATGSRAWALASGEGGGSSLWSSDDAGATWQSQHQQPDTWPSGLVTSEDGHVLVAGLATAASPRQTQLLVSRDAGATFSVENVFHLVGGQPLSQLTPLWVDPQPPYDIWAAGRVDTVTTLLQITSSGPPKEHLRLGVNIFDMQRDPQSRQLVAATGSGLYASANGMPFAPLKTVSTSRCLSAHGDSLYACAWNFEPDFAAIVQLSDSAKQRNRVFQYQDTLGPQSCPATSTVGKTCPMAWNIYAAQLGITVSQPMPKDMAGCAQVPGSGPRPGTWWVGALLLGGLAARRRPRRA